MVPPDPRAGAHSSAEAKVLDWLSRLPDTWWVLHSVGLAAHERKVWAEADMVVVGPPGVLVLEVKGGRLERRAGRWRHIDRDGRGNWKRESPFDQAGGATGALRRFLRGAAVVDADCVIGWAVVFPDIEVGDIGPEGLSPVTLDKGQPWGATPDRRLAGVASFWGERQGARGRLTEVMCRRIVESIRGDAVREPDPTAIAEAIEEEQRRRLAEHRRVLHAVRSNRRLWVQCSFGAGLVDLAVEATREMANASSRPVLVVPHPGLRSVLTQVLTDVDCQVVVDGEGVPDCDTMVMIDPSPGSSALARAVNHSSMEWVVFRDQHRGSLTGVSRHGHAPDDAVLVELDTAWLAPKGVCDGMGALLGRTLPSGVDAAGPMVSFVYWRTEAHHDALAATYLGDAATAYGVDLVAVTSVGTMRADLAAGLAAALDVELTPTTAGTHGPWQLDPTGPWGVRARFVLATGVCDLADADTRTALFDVASLGAIEVVVLLQENTRAAVNAAAAAWGAAQVS